MVDRALLAVHHAPFRALTVVVRSGDLKSQATITFDAPRIVIGRGEGCEIRLPDPSVSHRHASIRQRGSDYVVIDEGSTNGTFVGPVRLSPQAPRVVRSGDLIRVGRIWLELTTAQVLPTQNANLITKEIALALVASSLSAEGALSAPRLFVSEGAVLYGTPEHACATALDAEELAVDAASARNERLILLLDDLDHSWLFRLVHPTGTTQTSVQYRTMKCHFDPDLEVPSEVYRAPGTLVRRGR